MRKRPPSAPTTKRYLTLETITAAALAMLIVVVVVGSSNEKVSAWSPFSLERYVILSSGR